MAHSPKSSGQAWLAGGPNRHRLRLGEPGYPPLLQEIFDPPAILYVEGDVSLLSQPQIALVGARRATPSGLEVAKWLAGDLARAGAVVTSGMALGVDGAAHEGALEVGGPTVAVLGTGIDVAYPASHKKLARRIAETGALVSEFAPGEQPHSKNFPRRNRIISGLSLGVVVVEAARRSGSLITAHHALEQCREVFAVPGGLRNPLSSGPNSLIQQGAELVTSALDVLQGCGLEIPSGASKGTPPPVKVSKKLNRDANLLLSNLDYTPISPDGLVSRTGLPVMKVSALLGELVLAGRAHRTASGYVKQ